MNAARLARKSSQRAVLAIAGTAMAVPVAVVVAVSVAINSGNPVVAIAAVPVVMLVVMGLIAWGIRAIYVQNVGAPRKRRAELVRRSCAPKVQ